MTKEEFTDRMKLTAARRELAMRERVYPAWVRSRRMTQEKADYEIAVMAAIVADYQAVVEPPPDPTTSRYHTGGSEGPVDPE